MRNLAIALVGMAAVAFVLAVIDSAITGPILMIPAESFSRASNNLALLAIALMVIFPEKSAGASH